MKKERRKQLLRERRELSLSLENHQKIFANLLLVLEKMNPGRIGAYWPIRGEPDINEALREWCSSRGVKLYLPETLENGMVYREWTESSTFSKDRAGIPYPEGSVLENKAPDIILSPCVGYSEKGWRLGYGGGYFDRYLSEASHRKVITVGLVYDSLKVGSELFEDYDIPMNFIVTEKRVLDCK